MDSTKYDYSKLPYLAEKDLAYIRLDRRFREFYEYTPAIDSFEEIIAARKAFPTNRKSLHAELCKQYSHRTLTPEIEKHLDQLQGENTFTVCTAHQPCLFTGPLYFIYKIASTIHLAKQLTQRFPNHPIVPIFITGGEDHDFEEMNHLTIFGKRITWDRADAGGAVGRMSLEGIEDAIKEVSSILGENAPAQKVVQLLRTSYSEDKTYGEATIDFVHHLFKEFGLLIINMDCAAFKKQFISIMKDDLLHNTSSEIVVRTQQKIENQGFKNQAHVREINLFEHTDRGRQRIEQVGQKYVVGENEYTKEEIVSSIERSPESYSPNVVLRPLFQELILPNLAYIGGGGEIAYWLERKAQFEHYKIPYPMLIRRNSVLIINRSIKRNLDKSNLQIEDLFVEDLEYYITQWAVKQGEVSLSSYSDQLRELFVKVQSEASHIDASLKAYVAAEETKAQKILEQIERKMIKASKQRHEITISRIRKIYDQLFPGNSLQERKDNFLPYYMRYGQSFIRDLVDTLDPLESRFLVLEED